MRSIEVVKPKYESKFSNYINLTLYNCMVKLQLKGLVNPIYEDWIEFFAQEGKDALVLMCQELRESTTIESSDAEKILTHVLIEWDTDCIVIIKDRGEECRIG